MRGESQLIRAHHCLPELQDPQQVRHLPPATFLDCVHCAAAATSTSFHAVLQHASRSAHSHTATLAGATHSFNTDRVETVHGWNEGELCRKYTLTSLTH